MSTIPKRKKTARLQRALLTGWTIASLSALLLAFAPPARASSPQRHDSPPLAPTFLVIGDSITARYNDGPWSANRGWWSFVGEGYKAKMVTNATAGTGILARGGSRYCALGPKNTLTNFGYRTKRSLRTVKADAVIIAGGANDWHRCAPKNFVKKPLLTNSTTLIRQQMRKYLASLQVELKASALPTKQVIFLTPRGPAYKKQRDRAAKIWAQEVRRAGFTYIDVGVIPKSGTVDNTHPNLAGNRLIANRLIAKLPKEAPKFKAVVVPRPNWTPRK